MKKRNNLASIVMVLLSVALAVGVFCTPAYAKEFEYFPTGKYYELGEKENYTIDGSSVRVKTNTTNTLGLFSIAGDLIDKGNNVFYVQSGSVDISYKFDINKLETNKKKWHLVADKSKNVNGEKLDKDILKGAIIIQSSSNGQNWITDKVISNAFSGKETVPEVVFTTKDIQQLNGCFYRMLVVYKLEKQVDSSKILFWDKENYEYKRVAEVYSIFVIDQHTIDTGAASPAGKPRKEFSSVVNTGKDNGYDMSKAKDMDKDDPHFHKSIGYFTINGYTRETVDKDGTPVFLKTVGDEVTLWFSLTEDITRLFGNSKLSICEDSNGYDKVMVGGDQTNFKHGALFVKYTNEEGHSREAVTYLDFLRANTMTGAYTRIQLYEEGDYEIALDYEIKDTSFVVTTYHNYKIYFKFSIRNGNTMAFPRDAQTGSELKDGAWTANGFTIDMAESKYLTIDFVRKEVIQNANGTISTSVRDNKVGKEGSVYSKKGIYEITVKNQYSDGNPTTVTLYVGSDKNIIALAHNRMTVESFNELIKSGYTVDDDGTLIEPVKPTEPGTEPIKEPEPDTTDSEELPSEENPTVVDNPTNSEVENPEQESNPIVEKTTDTINDEESKIQKLTPIIPIVTLVVIAAAGGVVFGLKKTRSSNGEQ